MNPAAAPVLRPVTPVGILADRLEGLREQLRSESGVDAEVLAELDAVCALASGLDPYVEACTTPASEPLQRLSERTRRADWADVPGSGSLGLEAEMLSGHVEGRLLAFLVRTSGATSVLEVGMFTGYSALAMAEALPEDGRVVACEIDPDVARFARGCFDDSPHGGKIAIRVGPAIDTLIALDTAGDSFDFVFVDADKVGYAEYLDAVLDGGLLAPGGLICVDNTLMQGVPYLSGASSPNGDAIAAFNVKVVDDDRIEQVLLPVRDGVTLIRRV